MMMLMMMTLFLCWTRSAPVCAAARRRFPADVVTASWDEGLEVLKAGHASMRPTVKAIARVTTATLRRKHIMLPGMCGSKHCLDCLGALLG